MTRTPTANSRKGTLGGSNGTAGLLASLAHALLPSCAALARRATAMADRLIDGRATPADLNEAATLTAELLDATDTGLAMDDEGLLDAGFDG